jgi:hypothetical protein
MVDPEVSLISQKEKREVLANDRMARNTYFGHAGDVELELGGRFAKLTPTTVTGSEPTVKYPKLESGPWAKDECPPEPPLGIDINAQEPVGEAHERTETKPVVKGIKRRV